MTYSEFVNKELILFSNMDNERSIPNLVDGMLYIMYCIYNYLIMAPGFLESLTSVSTCVRALK